MSYVGMEKKCCPICTEIHDRNCGILIDKRFKDLPADPLVTGWDLCEDCFEQAKEYLTLIEIDPLKSNVSIKDLNNVHRTGRMVKIKIEVAKNFLKNIDPTSSPFMFTSPDVIDLLETTVNTKH